MKRKISTAFIPSLFTIFNLFSGFLAILQIFRSQYISAIMLMFLASIFDALDGKIARLIHQESNFGIEIDSLADIVSFCLVPALLVYDLYISELNFIGALISFFPLLFGAIRLARFNVHATGEKKKYYQGMPVPVAAITLGSFIWFNHTFSGYFGNSKIALPLVMLISFLMVSNIRFYPYPKISFKSGTFTTAKSIFTIICVILLIIYKGYVLFPVFGIYIVSNILHWISGYEEQRDFFLRRKDS